MYYSYINHDKRQYFTSGLWAHGVRFNYVGRGPGARALAILLSELGTWRNDRISVMGDDGVDSEEFAVIFREYVDVEVEAQLLLIDVDGLDWISKEIDESQLVLVDLCQFAIYFRHPKVIALLDSKYGVGVWQKNYEKHLRRYADSTSTQRFINAANRNLKLLK
ncbi:MAG: hypothetical protein AB7O26_15805 [Planctomycetaceae bacterium]